MRIERLAPRDLRDSHEQALELTPKVQDSRAGSIWPLDETRTEGQKHRLLLAALLHAGTGQLEQFVLLYELLRFFAEHSADDNHGRRTRHRTTAAERAIPAPTGGNETTTPPAPLTTMAPRTRHRPTSLAAAPAATITREPVASRLKRELQRHNTMYNQNANPKVRRGQNSTTYQHGFLRLNTAIN